MATLVRPERAGPVDEHPPEGGGGWRTMAWKDTEKGSASTAASSEMPSGTGISMESCAASCSAQAPGAPVMTPDVDAGAEVALGEAPAQAQVAGLARAGRAGRCPAARRSARG